MSAAGNGGGDRAQLLAIASAVLILIAVAACIGLPRMHLPTWPAAIVDRTGAAGTAFFPSAACSRGGLAIAAPRGRTAPRNRSQSAGHHAAAG